MATWLRDLLSQFLLVRWSLERHRHLPMLRVDTHPAPRRRFYLLSQKVRTTPAEHDFPRLTITATQVKIRADLAYACLKSVPNHREPALRLLNSLRTYLEFQSTKVYLQDPPTGFLFPAVDLDAELDQIQKNVEQGLYESEYDMQLDINSLLTAARDGHLYWQADLMSALIFERDIRIGLATVSSDGVQTPQIYAAGNAQWIRRGVSDVGH